MEKTQMFKCVAIWLHTLTQYRTRSNADSACGQTGNRKESRNALQIQQDEIFKSRELLRQKRSCIFLQ